MASTISIEHTSSQIPSAPYHLIYFITGNPGLISYYSVFLETLHQLLLSSSFNYHIFGQNLAGFEDNDTPPKSTGLPYSLENQIELKLKSLNEQRIPSGPRQGQHYDGIIVMGHSVGTYIILEILQRLRKSSSSLNVRGGILLMPTVVGLAESPSGVKAAPLLRLPGFVGGLSMFGKGLVWPLPRSVLIWAVRAVLGMSEHSAGVTTRFLKSRMGIWQAL
jgi:pimeloyl-ACP methyl ester carboxylesterase